MGRKNFYVQPPKGEGNGVEDGWRVSVRRVGNRPWHNAWGRQSQKNGSWDDWFWDRASGKWVEQRAWFCGECGTKHTNMGKRECRACGHTRPGPQAEEEQAEQPTAMPAPSGKQAALAIARYMNTKQAEHDEKTKKEKTKQKALKLPGAWPQWTPLATKARARRKRQAKAKKARAKREHRHHKAKRSFFNY